MLAIVLSRHDFREYDQVISLYTQTHGKKEALARGVKKITSKNSGSLEPFSLVEVEIIPGKEIDHIGSVKIVDLFKYIRDDFTKLFAAQWAVSLTEQLFSVAEPDSVNFNLLISWFEELNRARNINSVILDALVLRLLVRLGFAPELSFCVRCDRSLLPFPKGERRGGLLSSPPARGGVTGGWEPLPRASDFDIAAGGLICKECYQKQVVALNFFPLNGVVLQSLRTIMHVDWKTIFFLKLDKKETVELHQLIYRFAMFHSGKELKDWAVDKILLDKQNQKI